MRRCVLVIGRSVPIRFGTNSRWKPVTVSFSSAKVNVFLQLRLSQLCFSHYNIPQSELLHEGIEVSILRCSWKASIWKDDMFLSIWFAWFCFTNFEIEQFNFVVVVQLPEVIKWVLCSVGCLLKSEILSISLLEKKLNVQNNADLFSMSVSTDKPWVNKVWKRQI